MPFTKSPVSILSSAHHSALFFTHSGISFEPVSGQDVLGGTSIMLSLIKYCIPSTKSLLPIDP